MELDPTAAQGWPYSRAVVGAAALVFGAAVLAFVAALAGGFAWDDGILIVNNALLHSFDHVGEALSKGFWNTSAATHGMNEVYQSTYRPVVSLAFLTQWTLFDGSARGFHAVSLLLHGVCSVFAFDLLRRRLPAKPGTLIAALVGALVFALHPSRTESVAWVSGSTELWMALFALGGWWVWERGGERLGVAVLAAVLLTLAIFAKETAVVVPLALLIDHGCRGKRLPRASWGILFGVVGAGLATRFMLMPLPSGGAPFEFIAAATRVIGSLGHYVEITIWPWTPSAQRAFRYATCPGQSAFAPHTLWIGGAIALLAATLFAVAIKRASLRPWFADACWFLLPLAPVANLLDLQGQVWVAERFLYLPVLGVGALTARGLWTINERSAAAGKMTTLAMCLLAFAFGVVGASHVPHFRSSRTLWEYEYSIDQDNPNAITHIADIRYQERDFPASLALLQQGFAGAVRRCNQPLARRFALMAAGRLLSTTPDTDQDTLRAIRAAYDGVHSGGDFVLETAGFQTTLKLSEAVRAQLLADKEHYLPQRAMAWARTLDLPGAEQQLQALVDDDSKDAGAWHLLINVYARQGKWDQAQQAAREALHGLPNAASIREMAAAADAARAIVQRPAQDDRQRALQEAQAQVILGAPEAARRIVAPLLQSAPADPLLVTSYVRVMIADRRFDLAEATVQAAMAADQSGRRDWNILLEKVRAAGSGR